MLRCLNAEESRNIREFLRESGYSIQALSARFEAGSAADMQMKLAVARATLEPGRLNTLFQWFWIGSPVARAVVREFIPEPVLELLLKSGMVAAEGAMLRGDVRVSPFNEFLVLSDHAAVNKEEQPADTVLWPNPTSRLCSRMAMRVPVGRTLDLGTGCGVIALTAATHSGSVVATDLNPRTREFCLFNAALNGLSNIEFRGGSAFEPVRGERFDLILSNPPFFVTPTVRRVLSDNDSELDGFCRRLVREAPLHLNENGYCQMMAEWVQVKGQSWSARVSEWVEGIGCDAWVIASYLRPTLDYTLTHLREDCDAVTGSESQVARVGEWQEYFGSRQVEAICGGIIVLRRRDGKNWVRIDELMSPMMRPFGNFMRRIFEVRDALGCRSDEELLQTRPMLSPAARLTKEFSMTSEGWKTGATNLRMSEGVPYSFGVPPQTAELVSLCSGKLTLEEIAEQLAASMSVHRAIVRGECCAIIRQLADCGIMAL